MALDRSPEFLRLPWPILFFVTFRKEFTRISECPYSTSSPISLIPCLLTDQNFANNSEKGHSRNISMKLFQNLTSSFGEEDFLEICSCPYGESSPHSLEPCLMRDKNFANNFRKRSLKEHFCDIISKSDQRFLRRFFMNFFMSV